MAKTKIADAHDLAPGEGKVLEAGGKTLALFNVDGTFYAIDNTCRHRGGPLGEGELDGTIVTCPWHGWRYDVSSGANTMNPAITVASYPVTVEGGAVVVDL